MPELNEFQKVMFVSFLHDFGKLVVRAKETKFKHEWWSNNFVNRMPDFISEKLSELLKPENWDNKHTRVSEIMKIGDNLACFEREELSKEDKKKENVDFIPLSSIFENIFNNKKDRDYFYYPTSMNPEYEEVFPEKNKVSEKVKISFSDIYEDFKKDFERLNEKFKEEQNIDKYFLYLNHLFMKHLTFVPSASWIHEPTVSLYDHSRVSSAISCALYKQLELNKELDSVSQIYREIRNFVDPKGKNYDEKIFKDKKYFALIHGDISGIQNFIYTIKSKNALKTLRGRSSFLALLNDALAIYITNKFGLPQTNIVYSGGGHFYILSYADSLNQIEEIRKELNKIIYEEFGLDLYLCLGGIELSCFDFTQEEITKKWRDVSKTTSKQKNQKFKELFSEEFFSPQKKGGNLCSCSVCNREIDRNSDEKIFIESSDGLSFVELKKEEKTEKSIYCKNCVSFVNFGKKLAGKDKVNKFSLELLNKIELPFFNKLSINDWQFEFNLGKIEAPFMFFPMNRKHPESFEDLVYEKPDKFIGVLKMDVDNLGKIFTEGLGQKTLSSVAHLSSLLSFFFKGCINSIINKEEYEDILVVYSGGDDVLVVGYYAKTIDFAKEFYSKFREFTCLNEKITISAGISIVKPHFPFSRAVELAENGLDSAKKKDSLKNKINIMGINMTWDYPNEKITNFDGVDTDNKIWKNEFILTYSLYKELVKLVTTEDKNEKINRGFLDRMINSVEGFDKVLNSKELDVPAIWRLKYHLIRNYEKEHSEIHSIAEMIDKIVRHNIENKDGENFRNIMLFALAGKLAELKTKSDDKNKKNEVNQNVE